MKTIIKSSMIAAAFAIPAAAMAAAPISYEEKMAHHEESMILTSPIAGIHNSKWYDYRTDVNESKKELASDLHRASDLEDQRDAWGEYAHELKDNRQDYVKAMAKKGYKYSVIVEHPGR